MYLCAFRKFGFVKKTVITSFMSAHCVFVSTSSATWNEARECFFYLKGSLFSLWITMLNNRVTFIVRNVWNFKLHTCCWSLLEISAWSSGVKNSDHLVETTVDLTAIQVKWHTICSNQLILIIKKIPKHLTEYVRMNVTIKYLGSYKFYLLTRVL